MKCPKCRFENPRGMRFCGECGAKLEAVCPNCEASNPLEFKFCGACGRNLTSPVDSSLSKDLSFDEKLARIQKYLPGGLTEKILSQRDRIEGERRHVTIMFVDMKGFTQLTEKLGPEETFSLMDKVFELIIHKVHEYEGTVNEIRGDGVLAFFGAPIALEDSPQRAIRSSLAIHRELTRFSDRLKTEKKIQPVLVRIGINSGPVVVGTVGNDLRVQFTAVGDTINMAARMEQLAEPGTTYVTENTFRLVEGYFRFEALGNKEIKGKEEPMKVYRVIAPGSRRTRFEVSAERGLAPLVGREREIELLLDGFLEAKAGHGRAFSVAAEAGVGKSRLLYEFRKSVASEDVTFLEGKCLSYGRAMAYHPVADMLKGSFYIQDGDGEPEIRGKVSRGLQAQGMNEAWSMPVFLELLSVKDSGIDRLPISPEARKEKVVETLKTFVIKASERRPLILAIEDLHWVDESSEDLLRHVLGAMPAARVLLILTYRLEFVPAWGAKSYHTQIDLRRLSKEESCTMISNLLDTHALAPDLEKVVLGHAEGIPLFIEELVKALRDLEMIEIAGGTYRLAGDVQEMKVPWTIQEIIMSRVDSLPEAARQVLQTGAVIEREFSYELIGRVTGLPERELLSHLSILKDSELIYERGIFPQSSYIFKHALTRDAVLDSIVSAKKRRIHEQIALAIEEIFEDSLDEHYGALVGYYEAAESYEKAAECARLAGQKAERTGAIKDAIDYCKRRVVALERLPVTQDVQEKIVDARADLGRQLTQTFHYLEAKHALDPLSQVILEGRYRKRLPEILSILGTYEFCLKEDIQTALEHLEQAACMSLELKDMLSLAFANWRLGLALSMNCEFERAARCFQQALDVCTAANSLWAISRLKSYIGFFVHYLSGRIDVGFETTKQALQMADDSADSYSRAFGNIYHGISCYGKGLFTEASKHLAVGLDLCQAADIPMLEGLGHLFAGELAYETRKYDSSQSHFCSAERLFNRGFPSAVGLARIGSSMAGAMLDESFIDLEYHYEYVSSNRLKFCEPWKLRYLGELSLNGDHRQTQTGKSENWIGQAVESASRYGMRWYLARSLELHAKLLRKKGDRSLACDCLKKAMGIYEECGADGWRDKIETDLKHMFSK